MGSAAKSTVEETAERVYAAVRVAASALEITLPAWELLTEDQGRPWFAVANAKALVSAQPADTKEPYAYPLQTPIEELRVCDVFEGVDGSPSTDTSVYEEDLPTSLAIRPMVAGDLCRREHEGGTALWNTAIRAHVHGIDLELYEERLDPADAEVANTLIHEATGKDAWQILRAIYARAGGPEIGVGMHGWRAAAMELLAEDVGSHFLLQCRTPGLGTLKIGPIRVGHTRVYDDVSAEMTEWDGRLEALAKATKRDLIEMKSMRIEDADRAWSCFERLKKKAAARARAFFVALRSSQSTDGSKPTSTPSPSTS